MFTRKTALIALAVVTTAAVMATSFHAAAQVGPLTQVNRLTFSRPVSLPGVTLAAGTYMFQRDANPNTNIVRVLTRNYETMIYLGITTTVARPAGFRDTISFGEAAPGRATPIIAWYPVGSGQGHQFLYR
jgi:hypothetical protein